MSRAKGTYSTLENWVLDLAHTLPGAAGWVLMKLAAQTNYKRKTMTIGQLMDALGYDARTLNKACTFLEQEGYILCTNGEHVLRGSCTALAQAVNKPRTSLAKQDASQTTKTESYSGITEHNKKEVEGIQKEGNKEQKDPPTPQGEARESAAPGLVDSDFEELFGEEPPVGGAADAASQELTPLTETKSSTPEGEDGKDTSKPKVPRRAAEKFDPLSLELPVSVSSESWAKFCQHRRDKKKPLTRLAAEMTLDGLAEAAEIGWEPAQLIKDAILHGWTTCVFKEHKHPPRAAHVVQFTPPVSARRSYDEPAATSYPRRSYE